MIFNEKSKLEIFALKITVFYGAFAR